VENIMAPEIRTQAIVQLDGANFGAAFETDRACAATHDVGAG
jgi:hypothetical protein